jgi:hypothetical protein
MASPEILYVNVCSIGKDQNTVNGQPVVYTEARGTPLVSVANDYRASILRFQCNGLDLPLFCPEITNLADDTTAYTVKLSCTSQLISFVNGTEQGTTPAVNLAIESTYPVTWTPDTIAEGSVDGKVTNLADVFSSRYYWASSYTHVLGLINIAILNAWKDIATNETQQINLINPTGPFQYSQSPNQVQPPRFIFRNGKFVLQGDPCFFGARPVVPSTGTIPVLIRNVSLTVNAPLYSLLMGFPATRIRTVTGGISDAFRIITDNCTPIDLSAGDFTVFNGGKAGSTGAKYGVSTDCSREPIMQYEVEEEYTSSDAWSPIDCIVFTSTMPFQPEAQGTPLKLGAGSGGFATSSNIVASFTDLALPLAGGASDYLTKLTYAPVAQYRWLDFTSSEPLNNINFQLFWRCRFDDALYPVFFGTRGSVSMKMLLQRKY